PVRLPHFNRRCSRRLGNAEFIPGKKGTNCQAYKLWLQQIEQQSGGGELRRYFALENHDSLQHARQFSPPFSR
ncbi:MAG: hypothetical protein L6Q97_25790, partial [Thermoanaerobaculia bacterium]|nr:hypothetical protein [Thermoanaerobaculia bacterium]